MQRQGFIGITWEGHKSCIYILVSKVIMWDVKRVDQKAAVYCNTWNISTPSRSQFHGKSSKISWIQTGCDIHKSLVFDGKKSSPHPTTEVQHVWME